MTSTTSRPNRAYDVAVVGAGPAGMMAAGGAAGRGRRVVLLEKNARPGRKLGITGKGRCNVTNDCPPEEFFDSVPGGGKFLYSSVAAFSAADTVRFFEGLGVPMKTERGGRVFPMSDRAGDVVAAMERFFRRSGAELVRAEARGLILEGGRVTGVRTSAGDIAAESVVIATGGLSYPGTGSTGDGYRFAREAGHTVVEPAGSLVPLELDGDFHEELAGLSLRNIAVSVEDRKRDKVVYDDFGEMLFTHFGVSGPVILSASAHMRPMEPGRYVLRLDLKPALDMETLDRRVQRDFSQYLNRALGNALFDLLPRALAPKVIEAAGLDPEKQVNAVTREERRALCATLKGVRLTVAGARPVAEAIVTAGGVKLSQVHPATMASKLVKGLYFAGEVLDLDAYTGGFNLQIAFSTGYAAGMSV